MVPGSVAAIVQHKGKVRALPAVAEDVLPLAGMMQCKIPLCWLFVVYSNGQRKAGFPTRPLRSTPRTPTTHESG